MSLKPGTVVKIYKGTPRFEDGAVSRILDYDPLQKEYLVGENLGEDDHWVKEDVVAEIDFEKPKSDKLHNIIAAICAMLSVVGCYHVVVYIDSLIK